MNAAKQNEYRQAARDAALQILAALDRAETRAERAEALHIPPNSWDVIAAAKTAQDLRAIAYNLTGTTDTAND